MIDKNDKYLGFKPTKDDAYPTALTLDDYYPVLELPPSIRDD